MYLPRTIYKFTKGGKIKFTQSIDRTKFTLESLSAHARSEIGRLIVNRTWIKVRKIAGGKLGKGKSRRVGAAWQYWNRKIDKDLQVGIKHDTWYGVDQELGLNNQPKRDILRSTVFESIEDIQAITEAYLGKIDNEEAVNRIITQRPEEFSEDD